MLFGGSQDALKADKDNVVELMGANALGSPPHVFLLEAADPFADGGFNFPLGFHGDLEIVRSPALEPRIRFAEGSVLSLLVSKYQQASIAKRKTIPLIFMISVGQ